MAKKEVNEKDIVEDLQAQPVMESVERTDQPDDTPQDSQVSDSELEQAAKEADAIDAPQKKVAIKSRSSGGRSRKKIILLVSGIVALILIVLFSVPLTRYALLGTFIKKNVSFSIVDSKTNKPVSGMVISIAGISSTTDAHGDATFKAIPVGEKQVTARKKYYQDLSTHLTVPLFGVKKSYQLRVVATGRQVSVKILDKVSQQPLAKAIISYDGATSTTDTQGQTVLVLPASKTEATVSVAAANYNQQTDTVQITEQQDSRNTFTLIPSGKVYFLSNRTGTINVMKANVDGSDAQVVLAGTGNETDNTTLLASRDWKYLALESQRDGGTSAKLFLIDTTQGDKLTTIDTGNAVFNPIGWYNNYFLYTITRKDVQNWQPKQYAIKSFNAQTGQLLTLDENNAVGDSTAFAQEVYRYTYILNNTLIFTKTWSGSYSTAASQQPAIFAVQPDGSQRRTLATLPSNTSIQATLAGPQEVYFQITSLSPGTNTTTYTEFTDGQYKTANDVTATTFSKPYPPYLVSVSGKNTFWTETRDGKNTLFVGDIDGANAKQIASLSDYAPYGWFTDNYLLVSKNGSELYLMSPANPGNPIKITDYYRTSFPYYSYGYGYGGL